MNEKSTAQVKKTWVILSVSSLGLLSGLQTYSVSAEEQAASNSVPINQAQIESPQAASNSVPINQAQIESPQAVETSIAKVNPIASKGQ